MTFCLVLPLLHTSISKKQSLFQSLDVNLALIMFPVKNKNLLLVRKKMIHIAIWLAMTDLCHQFLGHVSYCHHWASVVHPSVNFSHFNQLLWNHWANFNQTLVEWSLDGPLPKLCPVIPTSNQDGRQAKNRKKRGWNFNCSLLL